MKKHGDRPWFLADNSPVSGQNQTKIFAMNYIRTILICLILVSIFSSCRFFRAPGKDDCDKILPRDMMVEVLTDIYLLEAFLAEYQHIERRVRDSASYYYGGIFSAHGLDPFEFELALSCYLLDRNEMDLIHEMMLNRLSMMESEVEQQFLDQEADFNEMIPQ